MILVDSSVWIDYFRGGATPQCVRLDTLLQAGEASLVVGDLILMEVLQGFRADRDYRLARSVFDRLPCLTLGGRRVAALAADNYRALRRHGITVRRTIDVLIGTYCIENRIDLLHSDRDFDPLVKHLGLRVV
jgi:predicted nucleic acid-binding protein